MSKLEIEKKWDTLSNEVGLEKNLFSQFLYWYTTPYRAYHNLIHINNCLDEFSEIKNFLSSKHEIELAIWFHDAIYDPYSKNNEKKSAELSYEILREQGLAESFIKKVSNYILATKHEKLFKDEDTKFLVDIDLSIFGKSKEKFDKYEKQIEQEYSRISLEQFNNGRAIIVKKFLDRTNIYQTDFFRERYEIKARKNLERSLSKLI